MKLLGMAEVKVYCKYEGENSQRHLGESGTQRGGRWNMASRLDLAMNKAREGNET